MVIYRTFSFGAIFRLWIVRLVFITAVVYALSHYNENPAVISIVSIVLTIFLLATGNDEVVVYNNRFVYKSGALLKYFSKKRVFYYEDIKEVTCEGIRIGILDIIYLNKESDQVTTSIHKYELKKAVEEINGQLRNKSSKKAFS